MNNLVSKAMVYTCGFGAFPHEHFKVIDFVLSHLLFQLTNNVVSDMNSSYIKPALGITWARMPNTRILLYDEIKEGPSPKLVKVTKSVKKVIIYIG